MPPDPEALADQLMREHAEGAQFRPFTGLLGRADVDGAYAIQRAYVRRLRAATGAAPAGYKIGLTSKRMQAMCGIDHPIAGVVLANRVHPSGTRLHARDYGRVGLEFEIAVRLGADLPASAAPFDRARVAAAVGAICPAVEVVDDRRADYAKLEVASLVADNSWNAGIVLGEWQSRWPDLEAVRGVVRLNGAEVDAGHGRDVLGHPFAPLVWLAEHLAQSGEGLRAGDIVMTGSLVTTRFPAETEAYEFELAGLGVVAVTVEV
jgi:2-keto-4-pentenoate hydratase